MDVSQETYESLVRSVAVITRSYLKKLGSIVDRIIPILLGRVGQ